jgi:hypothetical protein
MTEEAYWDKVLKKRRLHNTRLVLFGQKYKAFANKVPAGKTIIFSLQMAKKQLALSVIFR